MQNLNCNMEAATNALPKLKLHKVGTNDKIKGKKARKKVLLLFSELGLHKVGHNRQV